MVMSVKSVDLKASLRSLERELVPPGKVSDCVWVNVRGGVSVRVCVAA